MASATAPLAGAGSYLTLGTGLGVQGTGTVPVAVLGAAPGAALGAALGAAPDTGLETEVLTQLFHANPDHCRLSFAAINRMRQHSQVSGRISFVFFDIEHRRAPSSDLCTLKFVRMDSCYV